MIFLSVAFVTFFACLIAVPLLMAMAEFFCLFAVVQERESQVFLLFGRVVGVISEPGLHFLPVVLGPQSLLIRFFGGVRKVDMRIDQEYLRSQPVNSEEGTPMGIGVWYEMAVSDPVEYLFRNTDPRGSLRANVRNAAVRCLSNMPLQSLLEDRHSMSHRVRDEVSPKSIAWGYQLGSVYIRKVHFRDEGMIKQIEEKVVNRLRQVTSAIKQDGANQVNIIRSTADRQAAVEFARAAAMRPQIVGQALHEIAREPEIARAMFEVLETEKIVEGEADIALVPAGSGLLKEMLAAAEVKTGKAAPPPLVP